MGALSPLGLGIAGGLLAVTLAPRLAPQPSSPIAILDRGHLLKSLEEHLSEAERRERIRRFETAARHLADAGYLVIDRGWVIAAPEDFYVDLDPRSP